MKKFLAGAAAVLGPLMVAQAASAKLNIVTTTPDLAAIAREIGGVNVTVRSISRPDENPHFVEAKPSHIVTLNRADMLIEGGLELEIGWLPALLDQTRNAKILRGAPGRVVAAEFITPLEVPTGPIDRSQGDVHAAGNPHYLLDPVRGQTVARAIAQRLAVIDPANAAAYEANLQRLLVRIEEAHAEAQRLLGPHRGAKLVTYHKAFTYFAERYGLIVINTVERLPGIAPSPAHITALTAQMKNEGVRVILTERWDDKRMPQLVARQTGATVVLVPTMVGGADVPDYPALIRVLAERVANALAGAH